MAFYKITTTYNDGGNAGEGFYHTELNAYEFSIFGFGFLFLGAIGYWNADTEEELRENLDKIRIAAPKLIEKFKMVHTFYEEEKVEVN